jgi:MFS family permease
MEGQTMDEMPGPLAPARWLRLAPVVFVVYSVAIVDRANYGFGAAGGMAHDLGITDSTNALLAALFFLGNFFFQIPAAHYASRYSARWLIFWSLLLWGVLAAATGIITNLPLLFIDRFMLGVVESAVFPGTLIFLSHWFTKTERSRANSFMILGNPVTLLWMSVLSGYLVAHFGWRWMFIIEGIPAVIWAFVWLTLVDDHPAEADWLPADQRQAVESRLIAEQQELPPVRGYLAAFTQPRVLLLAFQYMFWSIGANGLVLWLPAILKAGSSYGMAGIGWLSAVPYVLGAITMFVGSVLSDKLQARRPFIWPCLMVGSAGFLLSYIFGIGHFWLAYVSIVIAAGALYVPYGPFFATIPEILPRNVAGAAFALVNSIGGLGAFAGAYLVGYLNALTQGPGASFLLLAGSLFTASLLGLAVRKPARAMLVEYPRTS